MPTRGENAHYWPVALPGGGSFLFFVRSTRPENNGIYLGSLDKKGQAVRLVTSLPAACMRRRWKRPRSPALGPRRRTPCTVVRYHAARLTGDVRTIATDVRVEESQRGNFASVATGRWCGPSAKAADLELAWFVAAAGSSSLPIARAR